MDSVSKLPRRAVTMWDFSWLTRRRGIEAEYRDWPVVLDELADRGYDCVRIDAFPHLVDAGEVTILPEPVSAQWGNSLPVTVDVRAGLREFLRLAGERRLRVGLSTWFNPDAHRHRERIRTPVDYARVWGATLRLVHDAHLEGCIEWVDLCNEFPFGGWAYGAYRELFGASPENPVPWFLPWNEATRARVQAHVDESIGALRTEFPDLRYTYSFMGMAKGNFRRLDTQSFDLAEPHVWLTDHAPFALASLGALSMAQLPFGELVHSKVGPRVYSTFRDRWLSHLDRHLRSLGRWASERQLPLYTSEGWATVMYGGLPEARSPDYWAWIRDVAEIVVDRAIDAGWTGICTSNFAQPHFPGMWADVEWHRRVTRRIRGVQAED